MTEEMVQMMLALVRSAMGGEPLTEAQRQACTPEVCRGVMRLAEKHDLKHLVADAMVKQQLMDDPDGRLKKAVYLAIYRHQRLEYVGKQTAAILETAGIPFLPLKGSVIRSRYPQPWMRTSCDLDILVHPEDLEKAVAALVTQGGFENKGRGYHDVTLKAPNGATVELHFSLLEDGRFPKAEAIMEQVWAHAAPVREGSMEHRMSDEMFLFHHILHMAYHIKEGGCGIRPFLDLWLLGREENREPREALLEAGGLLAFARTAADLAAVWFSEMPHRDMTRNLEHYILRGGVFGTAGNQAAMNQANTGGNAITSRIFLSPEILRGHYPVLERHGWLMPFCQVARWFRLLSPQRLRRAVKMVKADASTTTDQYTAAADLLHHLELEDSKPMT